MKQSLPQEEVPGLVPALQEVVEAALAIPPEVEQGLALPQRRGLAMALLPETPLAMLAEAMPSVLPGPQPVLRATVELYERIRQWQGKELL